MLRIERKTVYLIFFYFLLYSTIPYLASLKHHVFSFLRAHIAFRTRTASLLT
jgi:hypothetical protein